MPDEAPDPAGRLQIRVSASAAGARVRLGSSRPAAAARVLVGRDPAAAARLVPRLFSVCAAAQACACAAAIEEAAGEHPPPDIQLLRRRLLAAETLREHLWRILLDWPQALGEPAAAAAMAQVMRLHGAWHAALTRDLDPLQPQPCRAAGEDCAGSAAADPGAHQARADLAGLVAARVLDRAPRVWLSEIGDLAALGRWAAAGATPAARLIRWLLQDGRAGLGRCAVAPLPSLEPRALAVRLAEGSGEDFIRRPTWAGQARETSPFTRNLSAPLIADLAARFGNGLLSRVAAQLLEVAWLLADPDALPGAADRDPLPRRGRPTGEGLGLVPAARGLLAHRVVLADGRLVDYRILAPTEWNFHPQGVVPTGLGALAEAAGADVESLGRLFVITVDPCVPFDLLFVGGDRP